LIVSPFPGRHSVVLIVLFVSNTCSGGAQRARQMAGPPHPARSLTTCDVTRIVDGDTLVCGEAGRIRLIGIDTPELSQEPAGPLAARALASMISTGATVSLEMGVDARDQYGRLLAYIWIDSTLINWRMIREGWAVTLTYPPNVRYVDWFTAAVEAARNDGSGLWATGGFGCLPVDRRRGVC
jgi:micrococcal nuclease